MSDTTAANQRNFEIYALYCACKNCTVKEFRYTGQTTVGVQQRLQWHLNETLGACQKYRKKGLWCYKCRWIKKHRHENIRAELIELCENFDILQQREIYWIKELNTFHEDNSRGLNMDKGGGGILGYRHSTETRKLISEAGKGAVFSQERRDKIGKVHRGVPKSPEHRQKLREVNLGKTLSQETRDKMSESRMGRIVSEDTRKLIGDSHRGRPNRGSHTRWHINLGKPPKSYCVFCAEDGLFLEQLERLQENEG